MSDTTKASTTVTLEILHTDEYIHQVVALQRANHRKYISTEQMLEQGFVTAEYSFNDLKTMNEVEPSIIAKNERGEVVAYCLAKTAATRISIPELEPLFQVIENTVFDGKSLDKYRYLVIGQVCVGAGYRGIGLFDQLYRRMRQEYENRYELAVTEVAKRNVRSLRAHERIGFQEVHEHYDPDYDETWVTIVWDWRS